MMQKENHIFQGMRRDNHQIKQKAEFLWDALNIRITNRENSTLFSITNEKGTSDSLLTFTDSEYVGHCVLGNYLVVFTEEDDSCTIYRIEKEGDRFDYIILFRSGDKLWNAGNPIQTLGSYETDLVQKVYWIDGEHQPRVINITLPELKEVEFSKGEDLTDRLGLTDTSFDFVQILRLEEDVRITKQYGSGMFAPGVIQYAFSYYNKYGQETNIFHTTPLYYISYKDRGGKEDEKIANTFRIRIDNVDRFDYVRIYSIHRTSLDAIPTVKLVSDVEIDGAFVEYIDTGTVGETVDNNYLFYIGGRNIVPQCMTVKDNTLFFGNIELKDNQNDYRNIINESSVEFHDIPIRNTPYATGTVYYKNDSSLSKYSAGFKTNETYRLGVQVQDRNGIWSNPIRIKDDVLSTVYPQNSEGNIIQMSKSVTLNSSIVDELIDNGAVRIRTCIVFPTVNDRSVICQGVLCPTVYSAEGRHKSTTYSMPSWFFRAAGENIGIHIQYKHNYALYSGMDSGSEIQSMVPDEAVDKVSDINQFMYEDCQPYFFVDENIVTFHSPDIEFDTDLSNFPFEGTRLNIIGMAQLGAIYGDIDIETSSTDLKGEGFVHRIESYKTSNDRKYNGGLISGPFYNGSLVKKDGNGYTYKDVPFNFIVYPWHRNGSLNNDEARDDNSERTAVLKKKRISNLRFFNRNLFIKNIQYDITTPKLHSSTELSILKIGIPYNMGDVVYNGNVDTVIHSSKEYPIYIKESLINGGDQSIEDRFPDDDSYIKASTEPVRMKYKSTPHLVFALNSDTIDIPILPRHVSLDNLSDTFEVPDWWDNMNIGNPESDKDEDVAVEGELCYYVPKRDLMATSADYFYYTFRGMEKGAVYYNNLDGKIIKVSSGICQVYVKEGMLPDTDVSDYTPRNAANPDRYAYYTGPTRYYKLVDTGNVNESGNVIYDLEPHTVTPPAKAPGTGVHNITQKTFSDGGSEVPPYLLIGEITRDIDSDIRFGGNNEYAYKSNLWFPSGKSETLVKGKPITVKYEYGDTWYQRYDCLKTYAFTDEDQNQIVDIGSFLCETRLNLDGRTDRNKGNLSNLNASPVNFNLFNEVYNQKDNFFKYRILDKDFYKSSRYANQVTWTLEKVAGADIDNWTNITLANILDMDGSKGEVTSLNVWNDNLLCLQERQFSQLLYNSRVQIPVSDGVPIEIGNGKKMDGIRTISGSVGCSDGFSTASTSNGFYFLDSNTDSLYLFNGQLNNLTDSTGMSWWVKEHHGKYIKLFNDNVYGDIYLVSDDIALCFSEKLGQFTSQMSYGGVPAMFNYGDRFYSFNGCLNLYRNNDGRYNEFYGMPEPWYISFISNENSIYTKIFDTVDVRMDILNSNDRLPEGRPFSPVNYIEVCNEYQEGYSKTPAYTTLRNKNMMNKFRIWRCNIPRNNGTRQRIRNPWAMITLGHNNEGSVYNNNIRAVIHDVSVNYTL